MTGVLCIALAYSGIDDTDADGKYIEIVGYMGPTLEIIPDAA